MKRAMIVLLAFTWMFSQPVLADDEKAIRDLVEERIAMVIETIKRKDIDKAARDQIIIDTVVPFFDFDLMAQLSLGKTAWGQMTRPQRDEFTSLFVVRLQESYLEKLDLYTDEEVEIGEAQRNKNRIHITTYLVTATDKMEMIYKFYQKGDEWKVYDIEILGVSIVQTYRSQFAGVLRTNNIEELLAKLRQTGSFSVPTGDQ
jgi:phospholipid transport system substrate-binding protein